MNFEAVHLVWVEFASARLLPHISFPKPSFAKNRDIILQPDSNTHLASVALTNTTVPGMLMLKQSRATISVYIPKPPLWNVDIHVSRVS